MATNSAGVSAPIRSAWSARAIIAAASEWLDVHDDLHDEAAIERADGLVRQARRGLLQLTDHPDEVAGYRSILAAHAAVTTNPFTASRKRRTSSTETTDKPHTSRRTA